ncbi:hypothetical protein IHE44_0014884 [Lamprotornis superbus]|uniref:alpha-amylase n=1 Tax=Lamprotornis superbus TaxID=245042 RepID=A0A835P0K0_9PASS|nr:hypothetical protein IHE44_0014884 [Lamprotornis superbus]
MERGAAAGVCGEPAEEAGPLLCCPVPAFSSAAGSNTAAGLCWGQYNPNTLPKRTSIVHLFEWRWQDIALECERYLAPNGFGGVQISPPNENVIITDPQQPWWERYQPVSYKLCTRSGNETEFRDMVTRCNNVGVHIYVDAVINHMCGANAGAGDHATCGSYFNAKTEDFPAVPYSGWDFNDRKCKSRSGNIENYQDISQVRDCRLVSLLDLALEKDSVRSRIAEYLNRLLAVGVAGFRIDAAKHMWPVDVKAILDKLKDLNTQWFPAGTKPFIYQEVIDLGGEPIKGSDYFGNGRVTEFKYGAKLGTVIRKWNGEKMAYLKNWGEGWGFVPSDRALVFVDNHDNQRGHGAGGSSILTFWDARLYKMASGFMLAHPYGFTRVMSSFRWPRYFENGRDINDWVGPPSNKDGSIKPVTINEDTTCGNDWVCEHRWRQIKNMVIFRNVVDGEPFSNWWDNGSNQVSPPNENIVITNPNRPWWERYQPVSYKLCTRSGNEEEFRNMVTRCNNVGVRIYVDAVVNHMCGAAGGSGTHSTCGSYFNAGNRDFPAVPYSGWDFNDGKCHSASGEIENYGDIYQVRDCRLVSLLDLALEKDYVRSTVAQYLNHLIDIGVAGFRLDAAKHMWPGDIRAFLDKLNNLNTQWFAEGTKPFIYQEVIDLGGEPIKGSDYFGNGRVTEFKYGAKLGTVIRKWNGEKMAYLKNWGEGWGFVPSDRALVFVDNHDNQRGHGAGGSSILTFWDARLYKMASGFMLAHPYGFTRVMSSFRWPRYFENGRDINDWVGPPSNKDGSIKPVTINEDTTCGNDWVCEHRWRQIKNMVIFRNVVDGEPFSNWWDNGSNQVAFGRGNKGFIIFNNDDWNMNVYVQTGLPAGTYCDVISGQKENNKCTGKQVFVSGDGMANFQINTDAEDPFIAIHVDAKL